MASPEDTNLLLDTSAAYAFDFPDDLERLIFEKAAFRDHQTALQLIVVAKRVAHWFVINSLTFSTGKTDSTHRVEPLLYNYIPHKKTEQFLKSLADSSTAKPLDFYAAHVKAINISFINYIPDGTLPLILTRFSNLQNLALWINEDSQQSPTNLLDAWNEHDVCPCPKRFSGPLGRFFHKPKMQPNFGSPFFSRITHLHILDDIDIWSLWEGLESLPCLTHIAFRDDFASLERQETALTRFIELMLQKCLFLELILFVFNVGYGGEPMLRHIGVLYQDPRCVILDIPDIWKDWGAPFRGKSHLWTRAEEKVREQRRAMQNNKSW